RRSGETGGGRPPSRIKATGTDDGREVFSGGAPPERPLSVCRPGGRVLGGGLVRLPSLPPPPLPPPPPPPAVVVVPLSPGSPAVWAGTGVFGVTVSLCLRSCSLALWSARRMSSRALEYTETSGGRCFRVSR